MTDREWRNENDRKKDDNLIERDLPSLRHRDNSLCPQPTVSTPCTSEMLQQQNEDLCIAQCLGPRLQAASVPI